MRVLISFFAFCLIGASTPAGSAAGAAVLDDVLKAQGYVSVPMSRRANGKYFVQGVVHGSTLNFMLDFSNNDSLYDIRALRNLGVELEKTEIVIPTKRMNVRIHTGNIIGLQFAQHSTGTLKIHAGEVDAIYEVKPGTEGPDGVLGANFLATYGALLDLKGEMLHLKLK